MTIGIQVPDKINIKGSIQRGNLIMLKKHKDLFTTYTWHKNNPNVNFIAMVVDVISGWSYCMLELQIVYPCLDMEMWIDETLSYGKEDIEKRIELEDLNEEQYSIIVAMLL